MIPPFDQQTGQLPPGIHPATWTEFAERFGFSQRRRVLLGQLALVIDHLQQVGCRLLYVDGSFVTRKRNPGDFDICWEAAADIRRRMHEMFPFLIPTTRAMRLRQKTVYGGDIFPADAYAGSPQTFLEYFQEDRYGNPKGIVLLDLGSEL
ncbi:MAG: hypothetical protein NTZ05_15070 [Chloroflexi bacterium]|nr:hypothetical protein [Chloroflexota bacterium]